MEQGWHSFRVLSQSVFTCCDSASLLLFEKECCNQHNHRPGKQAGYTTRQQERRTTDSRTSLSPSLCRNVLGSLCSCSTVPSSSRWRRDPSTPSQEKPATPSVRTSSSGSRLTTKHWSVNSLCLRGSAAVLSDLNQCTTRYVSVTFDNDEDFKTKLEVMSSKKRQSLFFPEWMWSVASGFDPMETWSFSNSYVWTEDVICLKTGPTLLLCYSLYLSKESTAGLDWNHTDKPCCCRVVLVWNQVWTLS